MKQKLRSNRNKTGICSRLVFLLVIGLFLSACAPSPSLMEELTTPVSAEKTVVRWLVVGEGTEPWHQSAVNDFVAQFNRSQDEIKLDVQYAIGGGFGDLLSEGLAPDLVGPLSPNFSARFIEAWSDLDGLSVDGLALEKFDPATLKAWRREGRLIGLPFGYWPAVLYYNKDLFDRAGLPYPPHRYGEEYALGGAWTLDKVAEIAPHFAFDSLGRDALNPSYDVNQAVQWGFVIQGNFNAAAAIFGTASILDANGKVSIPPSWREAALWIHRAVWQEKFFPNEAGLDRMNGDPFGKGAAAMYYAPSWFMCCEADFNWDIAAVPSWAGKATSRREQAGFAIPQLSQHPEAAMKVAMALTSDPALLAAFRLVPARTDMRRNLAQQLAARQPGVDWQVLVDSINYPDDPPYSEFLPRAAGAFGLFNRFADGLLNDPNFAVEEELDRLEKDLQALMDQQSE